MSEKYVEFYIDCPSLLYNSNGYETRGQIREIHNYNVKLKAYINSNEMTGHHRPHVHISFKGMDYVCSIDDKIEILKPERCFPPAYRILTQAVKFNLSSCRKEWNRCETLIKFSPDELK